MSLAKTVAHAERRGTRLNKKEKKTQKLRTEASFAAACSFINEQKYKESVVNGF